MKPPRLGGEIVSWTAVECIRLVLTNEHLTWDPNDPSFTNQENAQTDSFRDVNWRYHQPLTVQALSTDLSATDVTHDDNFAAFLELYVAVNIADLLTASGAVQLRTHKAIDHLTIARRCGLAPDRSLQTIDRTTHLSKPKIGTVAYNHILQNIFSFCRVHYFV